MSEAARILVTVKAYPNISRRYGEVVCVAGIRTDEFELSWIRLFPVAFRDLAFSRRFSKYQFIELEVERHEADKRPESYRPNTDTLTLGEILSSKGDPSWSQRRECVEPLALQSMCEVQARQAETNLSLGAFKPGEVLDFEWEAVPERDPEKQAIADQPTLLFPTRDGLEHIPYRFRYRYRCDEEGCGGHFQSIIDWELGQAYRSWRDEYGEEAGLEKLRDKWLGEICGANRDTYFFVGNQHRHPESFLVLGAFWPLKVDNLQLRF